MAAMSKEELQEFMRLEFPQAYRMKMRVVSLENGVIEVRKEILPEMDLRPGGTIGGGTLMALADNTMYLLILSRIGPVALTVTTNLNINFLRKPAADRDLICTGKLLKLGKRLVVGMTETFSDGDPEPVAHVTMTWSIPPGSNI